MTSTLLQSVPPRILRLRRLSQGGAQVGVLRTQVLGKQIYLAAPSDCPLNADGSKRSADAASRGSVQLLVSTDEALTFEEACIPIRFLDKVRTKH